MPDEAPQPTESAKKKSPLKPIILVGAILVVEAVVIVGLMRVVGGGPDVSVAGVPEGLENDERERIVEVLVLDAKLPNDKSGFTYVYDTEVYVQVKQRHQERVEQELQQFRNEIKAEISAIWRTSEPHHFQEPKHENLTRKVRALLDDRFGRDHEQGEPIVRKTVIVMGTGFRVDA